MWEGMKNEARHRYWWFVYWVAGVIVLGVTWAFLLPIALFLKLGWWKDALRVFWLLDFTVVPVMAWKAASEKVPRLKKQP